MWESMYDKHLLAAETDLIRRHIIPGSKVLDVGCGEGEATLVYSSIPNVVVHAVDFSQTRLDKAKKRLSGQPNVRLEKVDLLGDYVLDKDYDFIVSQRVLINLMEWRLQKKVLLELMELLAPGGRLLLLEGSLEGVDSLNELRAAWGLEPIPVRWHNCFFADDRLLRCMQESGHELIETDGLGSYLMLTRGIRPTLDTALHWNSEFNRVAASQEVRSLLGIDNTKFSRLKLWVFQK